MEDSVNFRVNPARNAFTLIEMLAVMTVVTILGIMIAQAIQATSVAVTRSNKDLDAYAEMRQALDRIALDLTSRIRREDISVYFQKNAGNDALSFYSSVPSSLPTSAEPRGVSNLFYRINTTPQNPFSLQRASKGMSWSTSGGTTLPFVNPLAVFPIPTLPNDSDYDVLSPSIFRIELGYISAQSSPGEIRTTFPTSPRDLNNEMGALTITVAALDVESRKMLTSPSTQLSNLANQFEDATDSQSTFEKWSVLTRQPQQLADSAGIPLRAASQVRVMERRIPWK